MTPSPPWCRSRAGACQFEVPVDIDPADLEKQALEAVADRLGGKTPHKVIVKAPKIVSIVPAE